MVNSETREDDLQPDNRASVQQIKVDSNPFILAPKDRDYNGQYFHMYQHRLTKLRERVTKECIKRWDNGFKLNGMPVAMKPKVLDIQGNKPCWAIGSIYCEMKYKPNILEEVISDVYGAPDLAKSYTDPDGSDEIMLEDESGRVLLVGEYIRSTPFVTGTVIGVLGMEADAGTFQVLDICYPSSLPQRALPDIKLNGDKIIALVSGLNISTTSPGRLLKLQLLQEFLMGRLCAYDQVLNIAKLFICGNSLSYNPGKDAQGELVSCLEEFGKFLGNILQSIPVAMMPGANDPSDKALPQQPLHKALFQQSLRKYLEEINDDILELVTNPYKCNIEGIELLAVSGQSINDVCKYVIPYQKGQTSPLDKDTLEHRLDLMECTMRWQNIAPTAPDTLWTYPYRDSDPFILDELPHIYVIGNQPCYGVRDLNLRGAKVKIISIPEFSSTGDVVLLNLSTLETDIVNIQI